MENVKKHPIKLLELPISKFNDVAIPHHLELLRRHTININKFKAAGEWNKVYTEQVKAIGHVKQLKMLMYDMEMLRNQVFDKDIYIFDKLTTKSRTTTLEAINEYLESEFQLPHVEYESSDNKQEEIEQDSLNAESLQLSDQYDELERQKACLHAWNTLQENLQQLQQLYIDFNKVVMEQREHVDSIEHYVEEAEVNVVEGNRYLEKAVASKTMTYSIAGAVLGACLGGPVGLIAGVKLGSLTAVGLGAIGFAGGNKLCKKVQSNRTRTEGKPHKNSAKLSTKKD